MRGRAEEDALKAVEDAIKGAEREAEVQVPAIARGDGNYSLRQTGEMSAAAFNQLAEKVATFHVKSAQEQIDAVSKHWDMMRQEIAALTTALEKDFEEKMKKAKRDLEGAEETAKKIREDIQRHAEHMVELSDRLVNFGLKIDDAHKSFFGS